MWGSVGKPVGLELREFGHYAMKTCQTRTRLSETRGVEAKYPYKQCVSQITGAATHWKEIFITGENSICVHKGFVVANTIAGSRTAETG